MTTCQRKINLESGFTIDREKGLVRKNGTTETYELVQTQVGIIRDKHGNVIGTAVIAFSNRTARSRLNLSKLGVLARS